MIVFPAKPLPSDFDDRILDGGWWLHFGRQLARSGLYYYAGLPPLPHGRRLRRREHARRWHTIHQLRWQVIEQLRARVKRSIGIGQIELPPRPKHGPRCGPGSCADCAALRAWRIEAARRVGLSSDDSRGFL